MFDFLISSLKLFPLGRKMANKRNSKSYILCTTIKVMRVRSVTFCYPVNFTKFTNFPFGQDCKLFKVLYDAYNHKGGFQLLDLIITELKVTWPVIIQCLSLVEITAFRLESKSCKGFCFTNKFSTNESTRIYNMSCDL